MNRRCLTTIAFSDDHGDNSCTFHCQLPKHNGRHQVQGQIDNGAFTQPYILTWENVPVDQQTATKQESAYA